MPAAASDPARREAGGRHYGMDWLRIGAFHLLILYHIGMVFAPWEWFVKAAWTHDWVVLPMVATNAWRLTLLFLVSGFASGAMLARRPRLMDFLESRALRLGIPLLFGMAVVTPVQPWIQLSTQRGYHHGFGWFFVHDYWRFGRLGGIVLPAWQHLWFIAYLIVYTTGLVVLLALPPRVRAAGRRLVEVLTAGPLLLLVPLALSIAARLLWFPAAEDNHEFTGDWVAHVRHIPAFLFGYLLYGSDRLWRTIRAGWPTAACVALVSTIAVVEITREYPGTRPISDQMRQIYLALRVIQAWTSIVALIGIADRFWNRDHPWRATLAEAVFPFYIAHQTIIVVVGWLLMPTDLSGPARLLILIGTTLAGCWLFYLGGREVPLLRPLIGLRWRPRERPVRITEGAAA